MSDRLKFRMRQRRYRIERRGSSNSADAGLGSVDVEDAVETSIPAGGCAIATIAVGKQI